MGIFLFFDKTTEQVTIIQLVTILLIYKVLQNQDESFLLTCIVIHLQFNMGRSPNYGRNSNILIPDPYH